MDDIVQASPANSDPTWAADMEERRALPSLTAINFAHPNVGSQRVRGPRPHYVFLRYAYSRKVLTGHIERWCALSSDVNPHARTSSAKKGRGHETEKPCSGLLSTHTFDAAPCTEAP